MIDADLDKLVADLAADGLVVTREEANDAVQRVAEILLLVMQEKSLRLGEQSKSPISGDPPLPRIS
jgi:hypothetical protein